MSGATEHVLGNVNFGPAQPFSVEVANEVMDQMAESIVDLARKLEESDARVAVLEEEQKIFKKLLSERLDARVDLAGIADEDKAGVIEGRTVNTGRSDLSPRTTLETVAFLRKFNLWRRGGYDQQPPRAHEVGEAIDAACDHIERMEKEIEALRDALCEYKCRDKAAADGGWANI
jgi:hypothetical protein